MTIQDLNALNIAERKEELLKCCGSSGWVERMSALFPVRDEEHLFLEGEQIWYDLEEGDWLEAFTHHPKIGDIDSLKEKFGNTSQWAAGEQAAVKNTSEDVLRELAEGNQLYENKFGFIFIVCATGKSAEEMLALLKNRFRNSPEEELKNAMVEQNKITKIRLEKLLAA
jgi:2-oxo-4-hydroxy-4-carboxy-5-ureidoimidazoline decarboxylase